jgi:hypothetical protein
MRMATNFSSRSCSKESRATSSARWPRHDDGAVLVGHDHVAGIDRHAADADRRLHLDRMQVGHAGRRGGGGAVDRQVELADHRRVAHRAVAQHARHAAHLEPERQDVAQVPERVLPSVPITSTWPAGVSSIACALGARRIGRRRRLVEILAARNVAQRVGRARPAASPSG